MSSQRRFAWIHCLPLRPEPCGLGCQGALFCQLATESPGNVLLVARDTGLPRDSVANVVQVATLDRDTLTDRVGKLSESKLDLVLAGLDIVLGRD